MASMACEQRDLAGNSYAHAGDSWSTCFSFVEGFFLWCMAAFAAETSSYRRARSARGSFAALRILAGRGYLLSQLPRKVPHSLVNGMNRRKVLRLGRASVRRVLTQDDTLEDEDDNLEWIGAPSSFISAGDRQRQDGSAEISHCVRDFACGLPLRSRPQNASTSTGSPTSPQLVHRNVANKTCLLGRSDAQSKSSCSRNRT